MKQLPKLLFLFSTCFGVGEAVAQFASITPAVFVGPASENPQFIANAITGIRTGASSVGEFGTPEYWMGVIANNAQIPSWSLFYTPLFNSWNGQVVSGGNFGDQHGNSLYLGFSAQGYMSLDEITISFDAPYNSFDMAAGFLSPVSMGILWGENGQPDTIVMAPDPSQKFNQIISAGLSFSVKINPIFGLSNQERLYRAGDDEARFGDPYRMNLGFNAPGAESVISVQIVNINRVSPRIEVISVTKSAVRLRLDGISGFRYQIQHADAASGPWANLGNSFIVGTNRIFEFTDSNRPSIQFYRSINVP